MLIRYLVRRGTTDVYIWADHLAKRPDMMEVFAENPAEALTKKGIPDPNKVSIDEIESLSKHDLQIFAKVKLGLILDEAMVKAEMQDAIKERLIMRPTEEAMVAAISAGPFSTPRDARMKSGLASDTRPKGGVNAGTPVRA